ncbi:MAG: hypothetical protein OEV21_00780 [Thermoplasmata archaeon]|nr:hypothetical protein [Thermoplasmata archaeon]
MEENGMRYLARRKILSSVITMLMLASVVVGIVGETDAAQGAPCTYGYRWTDSNLPAPIVSYNWVEINTTGTDAQVSGDDQWGGPYPVGFEFNYFGTNYSAFNVTTNGLLIFGPGTNDYTNDYIPDTFNPDNILALYWDDMCVNYSVYNNGKIYYETIGSAPNRQLVVEWWQISRLGTTNLMTFEAILNETGQIWFQYETLSSTLGSSATVGIENYDGSDGVQYLYNSAILSDGLAIRFDMRAVTIGVDQWSSGFPSQDISYTLTVQNYQDITDSFDLTNTSISGWPVSYWDSTGTVLLVDNNGDINGYPDTGDIASGGTIDIVVIVSIPAAPTSVQEVTTIIATSFADNSQSDSATLTTNVLSVFEPPHSDYAVSDDADAYYEYLVVNVSLNISVSDDYYIYADLYSPTWNYIGGASNWTYLDAGIRIAGLWFTGTQISLAGYDGPYNVYLFLYDSSWNYIDFDSYTTGSYLASDFQPIGMFEPPHSDSGVDTDADLKYDYLAVDVVVNITTADDYEVQGYLYNASMVLIDTTTNLTFFWAGINSVRLMFDGGDIYSSGLDGPYYVYLDLYTDWGIWIDSDIHTTAAYLYTDFDSPPPAFMPPWYEDFESGTLGGTTGHNWTASIATQAGVSTATANSGIYSMYTRWNSVTVTSWEVNLSGLASAEVKCWIQRGDDAFSEDPDAGEDLIVQYRNVTGTWIDLETFMGSGTPGETYWRTYSLPADALGPHFQLRFYQTGGSGSNSDYWHIDDVYIGAPVDLAHLSPPYSETAIDSNSNLLYDWLVIDVPVNVTIAGVYTVQGILRDMFTTTIETVSNTTSLSVGMNIVQLWYAGINIGSNSVNGPYNVTIHLRDDVIGLLETDWYNTAAYSWFDFETWNSVPTAFFQVTPSVYGTTATVFTFDPSGSSDPEDSDIDLEMRWDWNNDAVWDTTWAALGSINHQFATPAVYTVVLQIRDTGWLTDTYAEILTVNESAPVTTATVSGETGQNGWYVSDVTVTLSVTDDFSGVNYTQYYIGSGSWQTYASPISLTSDGVFTVHYRSVDNSSLVEAIKSVTISIDTVAPVIAVDQADGTRFVNNSILISWVADDATSGILRIEISVDGGAFTSLGASITSMNLSGLPAGDHTIIVRAVDRAGHTAQDSIDIEVTAAQTSIIGDLLIWIILIAVIVAAVFLILLLLLRRKKGEPTTQYPVQQYPVQPQAPQQPMQPYAPPPAPTQPYSPPPYSPPGQRP